MGTVEGVVGFDLVILDSLAGLVLAEEREKKQELILQTYAITRVLTNWQKVMLRAGVAVLAINQLRINIGHEYGDLYIAPGDGALAAFASLRLRISRTGVD